MCGYVFLKEHRSSHTRHNDSPPHRQDEPANLHHQARGQGQGAVKPAMHLNQMWNHQKVEIRSNHRPHALLAVAPGLHRRLGHVHGRLKGNERAPWADPGHDPSHGHQEESDHPVVNVRDPLEDVVQGKIIFNIFHE